jgi:hypothetical protein
VLLRLAHLTVTNAFTYLCPLPMTDRDKTSKSWRCGISCSSYGARSASQPAPREARDEDHLDANFWHRGRSGLLGQSRVGGSPREPLEAYDVAVF